MKKRNVGQSKGEAETGGGEADSAPSQGCLEPPETGRSKEGLFLRDPEGILETC